MIYCNTGQNGFHGDYSDEMVVWYTHTKLQQNIFRLIITLYIFGGTAASYELTSIHPKLKIVKDKDV